MNLHMSSSRWFGSVNAKIEVKTNFDAIWFQEEQVCNMVLILKNIGGLLVFRNHERGAKLTVYKYFPMMK